MIRKIFSATVATAAILVATPALAGPGGHAGGAGGPGGRAGANANMGGAMGATHASPNSSLNRLDTTVPTTTTNPAVGVSQGPNHASINGIANANSRSVLGSGGVQSSTLPGLTTGLSVMNTGGTTIGTISQIVTDRSGNIRLVIVTNTSGQTFRLAPSTLQISGTTVTTTSTVGG